MEEQRIEEIRMEVNDWSIDDLRELANQLDMYADVLVEEEEKRNS